MKKLMILIMVVGTTIYGFNKTSAQGCCGKSKACAHKEAQSTTQNVQGNLAAKDSLKIYGKCGMCKTRIEKAAKSIKGVTGAQWNESTSMLVYSYDGTVKKEDVSNALLNVGHDTELGKASDKAYNKLPGCCKYR